MSLKLIINRDTKPIKSSLPEQKEPVSVTERVAAPAPKAIRIQITPEPINEPEMVSLKEETIEQASMDECDDAEDDEPELNGFSFSFGSGLTFKKCLENYHEVG